MHARTSLAALGGACLVGVWLSPSPVLPSASSASSTATSTTAAPTVELVGATSWIALTASLAQAAIPGNGGMCHPGRDLAGDNPLDPVCGAGSGICLIRGPETVREVGPWAHMASMACIQT